MTERDDQILFVDRNVADFIQRYAEKLEDIMPLVDEEALLRNSGLEGIEDEMDQLKFLAESIEAIMDQHEALAAEFDEKYAPDTIIEAAQLDRAETMAGLNADFGHRVRRAHGEIRLVSPEQAFDTLEECRNEIEELKMCDDCGDPCGELDD
jgi:hypothetical protein